MKVKQATLVDHLESSKVSQEKSMKKSFLNVPGTRPGYLVNWICVKVINTLFPFRKLWKYLIPATFCQAVPFPPKAIGMVYSPDEKNNMSFVSGKLNSFFTQSFDTFTL